MKIRIKVREFLSVMSSVDSFVTLSRGYETPFKNYLRMFSNGDNKLKIIVNNCTCMKLIETIECEDFDNIFDKIFLISDVSLFIKNLINYSFIDVENDVLYYDDGKYFLTSITLDDEKKNEIYNINKIDGCNNKFGVDSEIEDEIKSIFNVLKMRSDTHNYYFYRGGNLYFNFRDCYVKKNSILSFILTDIVSLRMIGDLLLKNKGKIISYKVEDDKLILYCDNFYFESNVALDDENANNYLESFFVDIKKLNTVKFKLEFYNTLNAVYTFDRNAPATVSIDDDKITFMQEGKTIGEFIIENVNDQIMINSSVLYKIFEYMIKNDKNISDLNIDIIEVNNCRFFYFKVNKVEIITEVI